MSKARQDYISASQVDQWLFCPLAYKYIYVDGCQRMPPNIYIVYGDAMHKALAFNYTQKITSRKDLPTNDIIEFFLEEFRKGVRTTPQHQWNLAGTLGLQGREMIHQYQEKIAPGIQPKFVEYKFELTLATLPVKILGYIDVITEDDIIIDHKNAGASTGDKWCQSAVDNNKQLTTYSLAFRKLFNRPEKGLRIDVLQRNKTGPSFKQIETQRSDLEVVALAQLMTRMNQIREADLWYPNLNSCQDCDFKNSCSRLCIQ